MPHIHRVGNDGDREWLIEYDFADGQWCLPGIFASSREEAERKLRAAGANGRVLGDVKVSQTVSVNVPFVILIFSLGAVVGVVAARIFWGL